MLPTPQLSLSVDGSAVCVEKMNYHHRILHIIEHLFYCAATLCNDFFSQSPNTLARFLCSALNPPTLYNANVTTLYRGLEREKNIHERSLKVITLKLQAKPHDRSYDKSIIFNQLIELVGVESNMELAPNAYDFQCNLSCIFTVKTLL